MVGPKNHFPNTSTNAARPRRHALTRVTRHAGSGRRGRTALAGFPGPAVLADQDAVVAALKRKDRKCRISQPRNAIRVLGWAQEYFSDGITEDSQ